MRGSRPPVLQTVGEKDYDGYVCSAAFGAF